MKNNYKHLNKIALIYHLIYTTIIIALIIIFFIFINEIYKANISKISIFNFVVIITLLSIFFVVYFLLSIFLLYIIYKQYIIEDKFKYITALFFLNPFIIFLEKKHKVEEYHQNRFSIIRTSILMGIFLGLYCISFLIVSFIVLPEFIEIPVGYILLIYFAFYNKFRYSLSLSIICSVLTIFFPGVYVLNPFQYYLDYGFCIIACSFVSLFKFEEEDKKLSTYYWILIILTISVIFYISRITSGIMYWFSDDYVMLNRFSYSIIFNAFNVICDFCIFIAIVPILCHRLNQKMWFLN
ncbi:energy-coupled thiamine transporter ThiT [Spiroplasma endosymbiont of Aspidapion aeneum]|uniref:energy-coupled thiamine transporter ThiT n=1 Tax=Spiroplasma endosymbiont of Aspidapion aeneum TaxID=3066276 RepID=UPI00313B7F9D